MSPDSPHSITNYVIFEIGPVPCCVDSNSVLAVIEPPAHITAIPGSNAYRPGLFAYQKKPVAVYDMRTKFNLSTEQRGKIILTEIDQQFFGFWVDKIQQIIDKSHGRSQLLPAECPKELFESVFTLQQQMIFKTSFIALSSAQVSTRAQQFIDSYLQQTENSIATKTNKTDTTKKTTSKKPIVNTRILEQKKQPINNNLNENTNKSGGKIRDKKNHVSSTTHTEIFNSADKTATPQKSNMDSTKLSAEKDSSSFENRNISHGEKSLTKSRINLTEATQLTPAKTTSFKSAPENKPSISEKNKLSKRISSSTTNNEKYTKPIAGMNSSYENSKQTARHTNDINQQTSSTVKKLTAAPDSKPDLTDRTSQQSKFSARSPTTLAAEKSDESSSSTGTLIISAIILLLIIIPLSYFSVPLIKSSTKPKTTTSYQKITESNNNISQGNLSTNSEYISPSTPDNDFNDITESDVALDEDNAVVDTSEKTVLTPATDITYFSSGDDTENNTTENNSEESRNHASIKQSDTEIIITLTGPDASLIKNKSSHPDSSMAFTKDSYKFRSSKVDNEESLNAASHEVLNKSEREINKTSSNEKATDTKEESNINTEETIIDKKTDVKPAPSVSKIIHIVVKGDTLWHIAKRYIQNPYKYNELARLSRIKNPDLIYPGNKVIILIKK